MSTPIPIITASGLTEPIWPTEEGATVVEVSLATSTTPTALSYT